MRHAILIFTADEKLFDDAGGEVWRPSENVVHELGAASVLYENRIMIFKEEQVYLASNFSSIGYISFENDKLGENGIELFRELVSFKDRQHLGRGIMSRKSAGLFRSGMPSPFLALGST